MTTLNIIINNSTQNEHLNITIGNTTYTPYSVQNLRYLNVVTHPDINLMDFQTPQHPLVFDVEYGTFDTVALLYSSICYYNNSDLSFTLAINQINTILSPVPPQNFVQLNPGNYISVTLPSGPFDQQSSEPCCVHSNTMVQTSMGDILIKNLITDRPIKVKDLQGNYIDVLYNIKFIPNNHFIRIKKDSFGIDKPNSDLLIREGHPIFINNNEIQPVDLIDNCNIFFDDIIDNDWTYSLCTNDRTFVMMNNIPVCTWAEHDWLNSSASKVFWIKQ